MNILNQFLDYFETNHFTLWLAAALAVLFCLKFVPFKFTISHRAAFLAVLAAGLVLRLGWIAFSSHEPETAWGARHLLESDVTNIHAIELTRGIWFHNAEGLPSGRRPIGYPLLLGALYKIFGPHAEIGWAANVALFAATLWFLFRITELILGPRAGLVAAFLFSTYPVSIYSVKLMTDEHLFLPLWYGGLLLLVKEIRRERVPGALWIYGVLFGFATMTRTNTIFMPAVVAFAYRLIGKSWKGAIGAFVLVFALMMAVNAPWVVRNYRAWGVPVLYTATAPFIYIQVNSTANAAGNGHIPERGEPGFSEDVERARDSGNEGLYHAACARAMREWILANPLRFGVMGIERVLIFMGWGRGGVWPIWFQYSPESFDPARPLSQPVREFLEESAYFAYYAVFFCAVFGLVRIVYVWRVLDPAARVSLWMLGTCAVFWLLQHMIIYPDRKYRFPLEPLMMIAASFFLEKLISHGPSRARSAV